jgi:lipoprotein-anchoring transpeptidase ErfK/SrfK
VNRLLGTAAAALAAVAVLCGCASAARSGGSVTHPTSARRTVSSLRAIGHPEFSPATSPSPARSAATHPTPSDQPTPIRKPKNFCAGNTASQKVIVSIAKQHAWMCARHKDVFDTPVTTGVVGQWTNTPTGNYVVQGRNTNTVLTLNTGAQYNVRYWIPFDAPLFGFHDSSWQQFPYGSPKYKTQGSHGCIHMPLKAMRFLYNWSARPTDVHIA